MLGFLMMTYCVRYISSVREQFRPVQLTDPLQEEKERVVMLIYNCDFACLLYTCTCTGRHFDPACLASKAQTHAEAQVCGMLPGVV